MNNERSTHMNDHRLAQEAEGKDPPFASGSPPGPGGRPLLVPLFLTTKAFGRAAAMSETTVKRMCDRGEIACIVISDRGDRRIPAVELDRLVTEAQANRMVGVG